MASALVLLLAASPSSAAQSVTLKWMPSPSEGVTGYEIAWSITEGQWANTADAGNVTQFTLNDLPDGTLFYTARAYAKK